MKEYLDAYVQTLNELQRYAGFAGLPDELLRDRLREHGDDWFHWWVIRPLGVIARYEEAVERLRSQLAGQQRIVEEYAAELAARQKNPPLPGAAEEGAHTHRMEILGQQVRVGTSAVADLTTALVSSTDAPVARARTGIARVLALTLLRLAGETQERIADLLQQARQTLGAAHEHVVRLNRLGTEARRVTEGAVNVGRFALPEAYRAILAGASVTVERAASPGATEGVPSPAAEAAA